MKMNNAKETYYDKYWSGKIKGKGHAKNCPKWNKKELENLYNFSKDQIKEKILDFGAGDGQLAGFLLSKGINTNNLYLVDISSIARKKALLKNDKLNYKIVQNNIIPYEQKTFNTIFATDVLEHILDIDQTVEEFYRVLNNKGCIIVVTPEYSLIKRILIALFFWNKIFYPNNPHVRFFTKKSLSIFLQDKGFKLIKYKWGISWFGLIPQNFYGVYKKEK